MIDKNDFFPQRPQIKPTIYVYELVGVEAHKGYIKVGYTERNVKERIEERIRKAYRRTYKITYRKAYKRGSTGIKEKGHK